MQCSGFFIVASLLMGGWAAVPPNDGRGGHGAATGNPHID